MLGTDSCTGRCENDSWERSWWRARQLLRWEGWCKFWKRRSKKEAEPELESRRMTFNGSMTARGDKQVSSSLERGECAGKRAFGNELPTYMKRPVWRVLSCYRAKGKEKEEEEEAEQPCKGVENLKSENFEMWRNFFNIRRITPCRYCKYLQFKSAYIFLTEHHIKLQYYYHYYYHYYYTILSVAVPGWSQDEIKMIVYLSCPSIHCCQMNIFKARF